MTQMTIYNYFANLEPVLKKQNKKPHNPKSKHKAGLFSRFSKNSQDGNLNSLTEDRA